MKIQCDVCNKEEASVYCSADEAALCKGCDHGVHHANKLASKHTRIALLNPTQTDAPRCDICQERRGYLFCREDKAILCRECDMGVHTANEFTKKHTRYVVTGVKIGVVVSDSQPSPKKKKKKDVAVVGIPVSTIQPPCVDTHTSNPSTGGGGGSTSSVSDYFSKAIQGWCVDEFLDPTPAPPNSDDDFYKIDNDIWVPDLPLHQLNQVYEQNNETHDNLMNPTPRMNKRWSDQHYAVPQISPQQCNRNQSLW